MSYDPPNREAATPSQDPGVHRTEDHIEIVWERGDRILVEVEVRDAVARLWWSADGFGGDPDAIERLRHVGPGPFADPVEFLDAVRRAFGNRVVIHLESPR